MPVKQLPVYYLGHLTELLSEHSVGLTGFLNSIGMTKEKLESPDTKLGTADFDQLMQSILIKKELAHLGLSLGKRLKIAHHGAFGLAILNANTIRDIVYFVQRYLALRVPFLEVSIYEENNELVVLVQDQHWQGELHVFMIEVMTVAMFNLFYAIRERHNELSINRIFFDYDAPFYLEKYDILEADSIEFSQAFCGLTVDLKWVDKKLTGSDSLSFQQAEKLCEQELIQQQLQLTAAGRVRQVLMQSSDTIPALQEVSSHLAVSPRTLHRELTKENTSFKQLIEQFRADRSKQLLLAYHQPVNVVALQLGYSDTANFRRAFKRWYGCSPSEFIERERKIVR